MNKLFIAASAAALLTAVGTVPSLAQSSSSSGASAMTMPSITCRDLSGMDQQTARNVVFYLGGLNAASGNSSAMNSTTGSGSSTTAADASGAGSSGSTTGSSTDTTGSGSSSTTADAGSSGSSSTSGSSGSSTDATGSTTAAGSGSSDNSGASAGGSSGASSAVMAQLPGFSMINADQIISTCQSSPDKQLSEVLGSAGSTAQ